MNKDSLCVILWQDPAYSFESEMPKDNPLPHLTAGWIVGMNNQYIKIGMNVAIDSHTGAWTIVDGFVIPASAIVEVKKIEA